MLDKMIRRLIRWLSWPWPPDAMTPCAWGDEVHARISRLVAAGHPQAAEDWTLYRSGHSLVCPAGDCWQGSA